MIQLHFSNMWLILVLILDTHNTHIISGCFDLSSIELVDSIHASLHFHGFLFAICCEFPSDFGQYWQV